MKVDTVILIFSDTEAHWAVKYAKSRKKEKIKFLAPFFSAREILRAADLPDRDYFEHPYFTHNFYNHSLKKLMNPVSKMTKLIKKTIKLTVLSTPLIEALETYIENEMLIVFFNKHYIEIIEKFWQPKKYLVSKVHSNLVLSNWEENAFSLGQLGAHYFFPRKKIRFFDSLPTPSISSATPLTLQHLTAYILRNRFVPYNLFDRFRQYVKKSRQTEIVFFASGANLLYYKGVLPKLCKRYKVVIVAGEQSAQDEFALRRLGVHSIPLRSLLRRNEKKRIDSLTVKTRNLFSVMLAEGAKKNQRIISPEMSKICRDALTLILEKHLTKTVQQIVLAEKAIAMFAPKLMITTHDPGPSSIPFVFAAKARHIKTLVLLHGWHNTTLGSDHKSDHIMVWGNYMAKWYADVLHKNPSTIHVAGFPHFDDLYANKQAWWQSKYSTENFSSKANIGILLTFYPPNTHASTVFFDDLFHQAREQNFLGTFKVRPRLDQNVDELKILAQRYQVRLELSAKGSLTDFVQRCDAIISWDTTAIYWPMIFGKPLFYTTPLWGSGMMPVEEYSAAWLPQSAHDFFILLKKLQENPMRLRKIIKGQRKFMKDVVGFYDDQAYKRVIGVIEKVLAL